MLMMLKDAYREYIRMSGGWWEVWDIRGRFYGLWYKGIRWAKGT